MYSKKVRIDELQKQPPEVFCEKKVFLEISQNSQENTCGRVSFLVSSACSFIENETLAQVLCCEFCEISKNNFFTEHLRVTASWVTLLYCYTGRNS